ncbi:MAG: molybdopterin-dependent oxidoreductase [Caulobacterales bacterium]
MADGARNLVRSVETTCPYCGVGCGVRAQATPERTACISGLESHPANFGRLCSKGMALGATLGLQSRLLHPEINGKRVYWDDAVADVARRLRSVIDAHGPDAVAFYVSGQLLTEDYYAANKLMKGYIGSANIDTNSRLCMASAVVAHKQAFGADLVPGCYEDLELADLVVFSGHNAAFTHPVLMRRMESAKGRGQKWIAIDPRRTDTAESADLHLPLAPQTDVRLWNGLLAWLIEHGAIDRDYLRDHVSGFDAAIGALARDDQSTQAIAQDCGLDVHAVEAFYALFAETPKTVSLFSMGANQSAQGVAKGAAIINCHLATGRIGKPGACPFSITGQPNAMGGRETGGMASTLAAHMDFDAVSRRRVQRFWNSPSIARKPGLKAVDMFDAVHDGRIKAVWIMATNPAVSMPNANKVREALANCPNVIVSECVGNTDTLEFAHVKLPAMGWSEKDGTVTNSERCISRQRALFDPAGEARADWRIIANVARAMGYEEGFDWRRPADIFREYAALTNFENAGRRFLSLGPLARLTDQDYEAMKPVQWPVKQAGGVARLFADGRFQTKDGRARIEVHAAKGPARKISKAFPLSLNTGRIRDQWHTMTRTGLAPDLCRHEPEPFVEMHPDDARAFEIDDGRLVRVETDFGEAVVLAKVTTAQRPGSLFMPMHWSRVFADAGLCNPMVEPKVDPLSGQPEFKHTPARVRAYAETWRGFFLARDCVAAPVGVDVVWRRTPIDGGYLHEFAGDGAVADADHVKLCLTSAAAGEVISFSDPLRGNKRWAEYLDGRLNRVLMIATSGTLPDRAWLTGVFAQDTLKIEDRTALLAGRALKGEPLGRIVCACMGIGETAIQKAIQCGAQDVEAIGAATRAGTNCGSCKTEIRRLLKDALAETSPTLEKEARYAA